MEYTTLTILIADDDFEDLELFEDRILKVEPTANVCKVTNGKAVLKYLANRRDDELPCLIILDYNMPELTGLEVLSTICKEERYADIPKVILSTSSTAGHINECMNNGATDYFVKPNNMGDLDSLARKMLAYCKNN
jgi:CheY-like chemotaxis protein